MNDITIDEVLHGDPGSFSVIKEIVEYMTWELRRQKHTSLNTIFEKQE